MSQSALAALLGKKPASPASSSSASAIPTPASVAAATPAVTPAVAVIPASAAPPPAPAVALSTPTPVLPPDRAPGLSPSSRPEPGPPAVPAGAAGVAPPDTLAALLGDFTAAAGKAPRVNPPQAAAVLAGPTAKEVAGHPEPAEVPEEKAAPVAKPADVLAAENAPKSRRTAAVVQVELDAALARIAELESSLVSGGELAGKAIAISQEGADGIMAEAAALIEQLRAEAAVSLEDNRKAWARVAVLEGAQPAPAGDSFGLKGPTFEGYVTFAEVANCIRALQDGLPSGVELKIVGQS